MTADEAAAEIGSESENECITVVVKDPGGGQVWYRIRKNTKMKRVIDKHTAVRKLPKTATLSFKGRILTSQDTAISLGMEESDIIECVDEAKSNTSYVVRVQDQSGIEIYFKVAGKQKVKRVMEAYGDLIRYPTQCFQFEYEGTMLEPNFTFRELGMKDGSTIVCWSPYPASAA